MTFYYRALCQMAGMAILASVTSTRAQEILGQGKTAPQLFASDCAICHKSPQGLVKNDRLFGVQNFLREHYTASRESAALLARYLDSVAEPPAQAKPARRARKPDSKPAGATPEVKPVATKPEPASVAKPEAASAPKVEAKPEAKPVEVKTESKPEAEPETKPGPKPEAKPEANTEANTEAKPASAEKPEKTE